MLSTTAINTSNTIRTQTGADLRKISRSCGQQNSSSQQVFQWECSQRMNGLSTNRPSFAAANQVVTLTRA